MTEITVIRGDSGQIIGLRGQGHSGDDPAGQNLICASVTTVFEFLSEAAEDLPESALTFQQDPQVPRWHIQVNPATLTPNDRETMESFFTAAYGVLQNISRRYPEQCRLIDGD